MVKYYRSVGLDDNHIEIKFGTRSRTSEVVQGTTDIGTLISCGNDERNGGHGTATNAGRGTLRWTMTWHDYGCQASERRWGSPRICREQRRGAGRNPELLPARARHRIERMFVLTMCGGL